MDGIDLASGSKWVANSIDATKRNVECHVFIKMPLTTVVMLMAVGMGMGMDGIDGGGDGSLGNVGVDCSNSAYEKTSYRTLSRAFDISQICMAFVSISCGWQTITVIQVETIKVAFEYAFSGNFILLQWKCNYFFAVEALN